MEPLAIIGIGCRFPGAKTPEAFWQNLRNGVDAITEVPSERWDIDAFYHPEAATPQKMNTRWSGFLEQVDQFEPSFFGIAPREAQHIDPQQRLLLEVSWEALENAGIVPESLAGSQTGVFIGISNADYHRLLYKDSSRIEAYSGAGTASSIASNRLSYLLNLRGTSLAIDTACSSSLVALHYACGSLLSLESNLCLVGGVNLILSPEPTITFSQARMMAADGRCKTFDASADGYVRGEGCGVVVLKRLSDALKDGDHIQAVIKGSAVNQDGLTNGLTAPNGPSQQALIRQALAKAGVQPAQISYIEAHGTGTSLGDPIEVNSLKTVLMEARELDQACWIGSVKTNIGHLEAAAGIAGLIKVVLSLQNKEIPPHLHLKQLNPYIKIKNTPIQIPTELQPWPAAADKRLAGVSSFGFGGTNAHVIVESAPVQKSQVQASDLGERPWHILTLSAKCEPALLELAQRYQELLANNSAPAIADLCFSANTGRSHFQHRLAVIASEKQELAEKLDKISARGEAAGLFSRKLSNNKTPKIAFLFTGQGSQYINMGRQLYETQPVFRQTLNQCCEILETYLDKPLLEILYGDEASENVLAQTAHTQVALFAIEYALYKLWQSWGIKPSVVMGHSVGEYVAATVAGVLSLEEGLKLIAHRGRLMQQLPPGGEMLSVMASVEQINQIITPYSEQVAIAAINGPESIVISGEAEAINTVKEIFETQEIKTKQLQVSHGFHSHLMSPMLADFRLIASEITYNQPSIPLVSNVTGERAQESIATPDYWVNHLLKPVKFAQSMATLHQEGYEVFLEIGPKPTLLGMGRQCLPEDVGVWLPSLRPSQEDWQLLLQSLGELYVRGVKVDWLGFDQDYYRSKVTLPTYPFQRQRYWIETSDSPSQTAADLDSENNTTEIVHLLKDGNTQELAKQIEQAGQFSPEQVNFLPEMLEIMVQQHQKQLVSETTKDFFYQVLWKQEEVEAQTQSRIEPGHWLIFADTTGVGEKLAQQLPQRECQCSLVYRSEEYQQLNEGTYQLNPAEPQEFEQLIEAIGVQSKLPLRGVIHLWSLDAPKTQALTITTLEQAQRWGCGAVLSIVKALIKTKSVAQLWLVTRGAIAVKSPSESVSVGASPLWGMGRVIALEHPQMWGGMVDLDPQTSETETETLLQFLANHHQPEDHLALRAEQRYIPRLVKQSWQPSPVPSFDSNATYLITGGLGALGLYTASWMVSQGAKHLVLISRTQPSEAKLAAISDLQQQGASIVVAQADVCNFEELSRVLEQVDNSQTALKGIVHGAGMGGFQPIQQMELTELEQVMAAKVMGGWNLHQLTLNLELDFFVSFSSIAAVWGGAGQAHYAAANHFLDGLTHYRRGSGLPSLSINWGPWSGGGMAGKVELEQLRRRGIEILSPQQGISALEQLWKNGNPQTTVANVNWSLFKQLYETGGKKLLCEIEVETLATQELNSKQNQLLKRLKSLPSGEQYNLLRTEIQSEVAKVLGLSDDQLPGFEQGFFELGMDSLMAVELRNRITQLLGVTLPATLGFDFPNIEQLTKYLSSQVLQLSSEDDDQQPEQSVKTVEHEPIAIIGMGCSFPGGASTPEKFWELLQSGTSAHTEIPASRWDINTYYDPDREAAGKMVTRYGHFINGVEQFDPGFFGISPREATAMDPQHRLLLEVSWQALERAGQKVERLASEPVGVFVGNDGHDYEQLIQEHLQQQPNSNLASYTGTGNSSSSAAGRLAYTFGFTGPTVTIDTACSSSLVAIHQACNSIRLGECSMAIAGGVKLHLTPQSYIFTSRTGMISPDGRCKTFDISADGYGRGEGCGMVVLKSLSQAQAEGDQILALIRGSAVNQDGPSSSLTVPNGQSQQKLIKKALKQAQLEPTDISYLEAHGTGTSLGDPIEVNAAAAVFGQERSPLHPLWIGTVKTNIGHLESAAGVSGLIKVVLSLQHQQIPAHLHLQQPNPKIDWQPWLQVSQALTPWVAPHGRFAGVSSFGFTGTNAHVVLCEAPPAASPTPEYERPLNLLQLSAKNDLALAQLAQKYVEHLQAHPEQDLRDICFTANSSRLAHTHRLAVIVGDREELQQKLSNFGQESIGVGLITGQVNSNKLTKVAMLFTGQGSQYVGMGRQLYHSQPTFKQVLDQCAEILKDYLDKPLLEILYGDEASENVLAQTAYTQVALFAIEYALYKLWQSWGIKPSVVMGHSVGEYVAATVAGVLSLEEGLKLIAHRGRLMQQLPPGGEMLSVMASVEQINQIITPYSEQVAIAAINGPESIVISGEAEAINTVKEIFETQEIKTKQLQVSHAFHSHLMQPMLVEFKAIANQITYNQPSIPLISNVTGERAQESIATPDYWVNHLLKPVKFAQSMETLHQEGYEVFLEIGPKPTLLGMGRQCLPEDVGVWLPSLRPSQEDWQQMLQSLGELYVRGVKVDWRVFDQDYCRSKVTLPTYPFQRQPYWIESSQNISKKQYFTASQNIHPLLGEKLNCAGKQGIFASFLKEDCPAYLRNHRVFNQALFPTTAYLEMAVAAGSNLWGNGSVVVEELSIKQGLILPPEELVNVQTVLTPSDNKSYQLQIFSQQDQHIQQELEWVLHATALIRQEETSDTQTNINLEKYQDDCSKPIDVKQHYQQCRQIGLDYGTSFQGIEKLWAGKNQALASIKLPEELISETIDYQLHPALLNAALQVSFDALPQTDSSKTYLQVGVEEFKIYGYPGLELWAYASVAEPTTDNQESWKARVILISPEGEIVASIKGLEVKLATKADLLGTETESITDWLYEIEWRSKGLLGRLGAPDFLLKPAEIAQKLTPDLTELVTQIDDNSTSVLASSLDELSVDYIVQGLLSIGWSYSLGETFDSNAAAGRLGVVPSQVRLFKRLLQILSEVGILESREQQWQVRQTLDQVNPTEKNQSLLRQFPDEGAALTLLDRCASQLGGVLRGAYDPVQLVFPQGDLTTAAQLYEDSRTAKVMNTIVQKAITQATEKLPPNRGIRLLEIGAGTGGTTSYVLPHLNPNQAQYIFTDIGGLFTGKAQEKFPDYQFLDYQTLDIEVDPRTQGFESHQYDVIIAANVLHATTNIKETLSNVKQLLAPGGMLVLYEATTRTLWLDLIFGLLEGWWKFQDYELRPDYPLLSRSQWKEVLAATGFTEVVTLPEMEGMPQIVSEQAVIVASAPQTIEPTASTPKNWLLLADEKGVARQLARKLNSAGDVCTLVFSGSEYQQISPTEFTINPYNPSEYEQLIGTFATSSTSVNGVVQCWSTQAGVDKTINCEELEKLSFLGCGTTLSLVQALVKGGLSQTPRLWLVTCGSQPVPANHPMIPGVIQSSLWGMGKVISLEHPELNCVRIDLDPQQTIEEQAKALFNEIWSQDREDQVAWRGDSRYVAKLVPSPSYPTQEKANTEKLLSFRSDATYLITGGTGGLALLVADWMVSKGAKNLVLVGRSSPDAATRKKLTELEMTGATVVLEKADVSDVTAMRSVLHKIENSKIPLAGIIHSAGMLSDGVLANQTWSSFEKVMAAKVQGAWHLHQLTQNQPLDFFVLFSSTASLLGSPGQGNHSAANGFLDGLAHYRRAMGLPGLSINWGAVSQVGEAAQRGADVRAHKHGIGVISPTLVLECLELLMSDTARTEGNLSPAEVGVVPIEWSAWQERVAKWPFLSDWKEIIQITSQSSDSEFLLKLQATAPEERRSLLVAHVRRQLSLVLGINNLESISLEAGFFDLGMDSLTSVELRNKLQISLGCSVPSTLAFDYPTVGELVDYLAQEILRIEFYNTSVTKSKEAGDEKHNEKQMQKLADAKQLSEEDLEQKIKHKLNLLIKEES